MTLVLSAYFAGFLAALGAVPACRHLAHRFGVVAKPNEERWHRRPTALLGGVAIAGCVLGGGLLLERSLELQLLLGCGAAAFALGLADDIRGLRPVTKLVGQIALAAAFVAFGYRLQWVDSLALDTMLTLFWIVGLTNAFNLLDNMDGLCAGVALIIGAMLILQLAGTGNLEAEAAYLALLMGALSAFLIFNFSPATIFMGDSGSLFIGLTLSAMSLGSFGGGSGRSELLSIVGVPVLVLVIPILDTTLVTASRLLSGRSPSQGGRDHTSHRLVAMGLPERSAVVVLWTLAAIGGLIPVALGRFSPDLAAPLGAAFVLAVAIFAVYLAGVKVYEEPDAALVSSGRITPMVVNFVFRRRLAEVLLDLCLVPLCYYVAYRLRFEGREFRGAFPVFLNTLPIVVAVQSLSLFAVGGYRGIWHYFGLMDGVTFVKGVVLGTIASIVGILYLYPTQTFSRGIFVIYAALLLIALVGSRASFRLIAEFVRRRRTGRRLVVYGAADGGALIVRELLGNPHQHYTMLGFVDDDPRKHKARVHGYPVLGGADALLRLVENGRVDFVIVSATQIPRSRMIELEASCRTHRVELARLHFDLEPVIAL